MKVELLIKGGHVVDPYADVNAVMDIAVNDGEIVDIGENSADAKLFVDASGYYVFPGLIDFHAHLFDGGSGFGVKPDLLLSTGVTTAVDAGSCGCANFKVFHSAVCVNSQLRIKTYLNLSPGGQVGYGVDEQADPALWDRNAISKVVQEYPNEIMGLKLRVGRAMLGELGIRPLMEAVNFSAQIGLPLSVHVTDSPLTAGEIAGSLQSGSIFCHVYNGKGHTILNGEDVCHAVREAVSRGVIFDAANGKRNFDFEVAERSMSQGLYPDIISTDVTLSTLNLGRDVKNLPYLMSKYMAMGMPLTDVVRCVTQTPARLMNMAGLIGTLRPNACADVTICKLAEGNFVFEDSKTNKRNARKLLIPVAVIRHGRIVFCQTDFMVYVN